MGSRQQKMTIVAPYFVGVGLQRGNQLNRIAGSNENVCRKHGDSLAQSVQQIFGQRDKLPSAGREIFVEKHGQSPRLFLAQGSFANMPV